MTRQQEKTETLKKTQANSLIILALFAVHSAFRYSIRVSNSKGENAHEKQTISK
jgi:hypothetical protein